MAFRSTGYRLLTLRNVIGLTIGLICLVLTLIRGVLVGRDAEQLLRMEVGLSLAGVAENVSDKLNGDMQARADQAQVLSRLDDLADPGRAQRLIDTLITYDRTLAWAGVTDAAGKVIAGARGILVGQNLSERPVYRNGIHGLFLGDVHEAVLLAKLLPNPTGEPMRFVDVAVPVKDPQDRVQGVLALHYSWSWAQHVIRHSLSPIRSREALDVIMVSSQGHVLLGPDGLIGQRLSLLSLVDAIDGKVGWRLETWPDGQSYVTGYASGTRQQVIGGLGWTVLVRQPVEIAYRPAAAMRWKVLWSGLLLAGLFGGFGWLAAHFITSPIRAIAVAARRISKGVPDATIPEVGGAREIHMLSRVLRELVSGLRASSRALVATNAALERAENIAYHDRLTALPNRHFFEQYLDIALSRAQRQGDMAALLYLDLDGFKPVNDRYGHDAGDEVLRQIGQRLAESLRPEDVAARIGGDEFACILVLPREEEDRVMEVAQRLVAAINEPIDILEGQVRVGTSIGVALWPDHGQTMAEVLKRADGAMYRAKQQGRNRVAFHLPPLVVPG
ncbi:diguanylate cyclase domain-containing protein [Niveispirillum fermenti]|uniref:diguanylate cyclase domain-containing protein n=1 Tax=Niveispirillum fermenti TaxID=1233113 RepID=UPI003A862422